MKVKHSKEGFQMLPPAPDRCPVCADKAHGDELPHNRDSLYYQFCFYNTYNRSPTWEDALISCSDETKLLWKEHLKKHGVKPEVIGEI